MPRPGAYRERMTTISSLTLEVDDLAASEQFYAAAFALEAVSLRQANAATSGFRGFSLSILMKQPADASAVLARAIAEGATVLKPAAKSIWGFGGVVRAPDGTIWKVATSAKKDTAPASPAVEKVVLLTAADDVSATKKFYVDRGLTVGRSFGKYVEFATGDDPIGFGLYSRKALAKDAGVPPEGNGSHRLVIRGGSFTDPDGFVWEA